MLYLCFPEDSNKIFCLPISLFIILISQYYKKASKEDATHAQKRLIQDNRYLSISRPIIHTQKKKKKRPMILISISQANQQNLQFDYMVKLFEYV